MLPFHFLNWTRKKLFSFAHPLDEQKIIISLSALMRQSLKSVSNTGVPSDFTGIPRKHFQWWYIIISWRLAVLYSFTLSKELNYIYEFKMGFCFQSTKKKKSHKTSFWWKDWKEYPVGSSWGIWVCLVWAWGCWGRISLLLKLPEKGKWRGRFCGLGSRGHMGKVQCCTKGGLHWTLESISLLRVWSNIATVFLERWSMPQGCQGLKDIWIMPLTKCFNKC